MSRAVSQWLDQARGIEADLIEIRRDFHRYPELSFQEERTARVVRAELEALGLIVRPAVGGHGVVADLVGNHPGPIIAFRADMDALPIEEQTGLPYASEHVGVMHACGHDAHTAIVLGAAKLLATSKDRLKGSVRFIFQSAEEILAGAKAMIDQGVLEGVEQIYGLHNLPQMTAGTIAVKPGVLMGSSDRLEIRVTGQGGHGGYPQTCIDPIVAASAVVMGLQTAVSREIAATDGVVVSLGMIQGGTAGNIIPDEVTLTGTIRTLDDELRRTIPERLERIVRDTCRAYRCEGTVQIGMQVGAVVNDPLCAELVNEVAEQLVGPDQCSVPLPMTYGEDFAFYLQQTKGCFFWLGSGSPEQPGANAPLHSSKFNLDERCLTVGAAMFASIADRLLIQDEAI